MSYDGYKANWGRSTNLDRGTSKNHLQATDLNSVYTTVSSNSASWSSGGDGSNTAISTDTQDIYTTFSTDSNFPKVKLLLHGEGTEGDTEIVDDSPNHYTVQNINSNTNFLTAGVKKYGSSSILLSGGTFTAGDSNFSSVGILFKFDGLTDGTSSGTVYDKSSNSNDATYNTGKISDAQSKWGTTSLSGTLDTTPAASYDVGTGAFTAEAWVYYTRQAASFTGTDEGRNNAMQIGHPNGSSFGIALALIIWDLTGSTVPSLNQWVHVAVCRSSGGRLSVFIDGTRTATETGNSNNYEAPDYFGLGPYGFVDSIRITKGVDVYGADNSSITVPTAAFPESASDTITGGGLKVQDEDFSIDGDFTIESFVRPMDITNGGVIYSSGTGHVLALSGATGKISYDGSGSAIATTVPVVTANTWSHIAVVREDNLLTVFANGVSALETTESATGNPLGTTQFTIGMDTNSGNIYSGFIDEFRITDGVARYSGSTYTVPAAAFSGESRFEKTVVTGVSGVAAEAITLETQAIKTFHSTDDEYHNVQLLLHCEGTNNDTDMDDDSRVGHHFEFNGNSKLSSTQKKFGSTSLFTGTSDNDHVLVDSDDTNFLELGTDDFTLEFWLYWDGVTGYQTVFDNGYGSGSTAGSWLIQTDNGNGRLKWYHNGGLLVTEGSDPANTTWLHYAIVRSSGTLKIYRNGIQTASGSTTNPYSTPDKLSIGARNAGTYPFDGYLDEIRITKGIARYSGSDTSSANFTVPSAAFSGEALETTTVVTGISGSVGEGSKIVSNYTTTNTYSADWNNTKTTTNSNSASWTSGSAKVWLNYNHMTPAIRSSYGVSTVTDNAAGQYTVNFSTNFSNNDYAVAGLTNGTNADANDTYNTYIFNETLMALSSCKITNQHSDGTENDLQISTLVFFGDQ
jgi:hypothetical protein